MKAIGEGMNIGEAAQKAGVTPKMVRHYEALGLLPKVHRTESGYRVYTGNEVHTLRFIKRSRDLGFSMAEIAELVKLWQDRRRPSASVRKVASAHLADLDRKIQELEAMRNTLRHLIHCCQGDDRPDCPILEDLEGLSGPAPKAA
ncbi:Cu(I)-responsive transcriptional regulator [Ramlibacter sp. MMS24-I3-19]|uniref:Cu(I)-responsive transcriptional regulator n=1 Tax=Ramlibacter sp. MMS24-I3-19 TaxID=3416606 RepID=UPI003D06663C